MNDENLVYYGGAVKALGDGRIGGYLVLFGDEQTPDLEGDFFTKNTDFGAHQTTMVLYQHGLDASLKRRVLDVQAPLKSDDTGVWVEAQLALRDEYEQAIYALAEQGKLGWSSGTAGHLIEREQKGAAWHITRWPLGLDASLTPTPAEPRTAAIPLKSIEIDPLAIEPAPQGAGEASGVAESRTQIDININIENDPPADDPPAIIREIKMSDQPTTEVVAEVDGSVSREEFKGLSGRFDTMTEQLTAFMQRLENAGPLKDAGFIAPDDEGTDKRQAKSFADFLLCVYRGNVKRLVTVYKSTKDLSGDTGTTGGYLVPEEFSNRLLQMTESASQIVPMVTTVPVGSDTGRYPALDQYITPTAGSGQTATAAGVVATATAPGATLTATDPGFEMIQWNINKVGGTTAVENELIADSAQAIEVLLTRLFGVAVRAKQEHLVLRGTGAGEPEGILNATAAVGITPATDNTFAWADALGMKARFKPVGGSPVWIIHPGIWPDIGAFESSAGGAVFQANMQAALGNNLLGYPIIQSEHLPQDDNAGCVLLADLSAYMLFERQGLAIAFSEHAAFTSDKGTWRFTTRMDGQSWLKSAITLADPQGGYTMSPFVYLND